MDTCTCGQKVVLEHFFRFGSDSDNFGAKSRSGVRFLIWQSIYAGDSEFCLSAYKLRSAAWNFEFAQLFEKKSSWREFFWGVKIFENFSIFFNFFLKIFHFFFRKIFGNFQLVVLGLKSALATGFLVVFFERFSKIKKNQKKNSEKNRISGFRDTFDCFEGVEHADLTFRSPAWPVIREVFCRKQWS